MPGEEKIGKQSDDVYDDMRALCRTVVDSRSVPAPRVYELLGNLKSAGGYTLGHVLSSSADALEKSLEHYDVYDATDRDPAESVAAAAADMRAAAALAMQIGKLLDAAQTAINSQGYRVPQAS